MWQNSCLTISLAILCTCLCVSAETCFTPDQLPGECISIRKCPKFLALLQTKPLTNKITEYLREAQCGFVDAKVPKVCCPTDSTNTNTNANTNNQATNTIDPDKVKLLPDGKQCGVSTEFRIFGGEVTEIDEFPWMALLEYQKPNGRGFYCGGVLISERYVLTAAHCVKGKDLPKTWKLVRVRLGEYDTSTDEDCVSNGVGGKDCTPTPQDIDVEEQIAHEGYNPFDTNQYHDIALLRLATPAKFGEFVSPICIPTTPNELRDEFYGRNLTVAGWGKTEKRSESNIKLKLQVPVRTTADCGNVYRNAGVQLGKGQMCAGGIRGKDSCRGDSGGPLMSYTLKDDGNAHWTCAGIVSFGPSPCGMEGWPGVYSRVTHYSPWIISKLRP